MTTSHYFDMEPTLIGNAPEDVFVKTMREICLKEEKNQESTIAASVKVYLFIPSSFDHHHSLVVTISFKNDVIIDIL